MTAKEMFQELGYEWVDLDLIENIDYIFKNKEAIIFTKIVNGYAHEIIFNIILKTYITFVGIDDHLIIDPKLHKAITQQLKELGAL